jgi:hypothetical protein
VAEGGAVTCLQRLINWFKLTQILQEQNDELHARVRVLECELEAAIRRGDDYEDRYLDVAEQLLEHSHGSCAVMRGER